MRFTEMTLPEVLRIDLDPIEDERGFFARVFCKELMEKQGVVTDIVQMNNTLTKTKGSIRGMHFQREPMAETKIVRCLRGAIFDVAVDLRHSSKTFGKWCAIELSGDNRSMAYIPRGFAHGFQTLEPDTELMYLHSKEYSASHESGVHPLDDSVNIAWPLAAKNMSARDQQLPALSEMEPLKIGQEDGS